MKKLSLSSKILSALSSLFALIAICSKWLSVNMNFGAQSRFSLFELSSVFSNMRLFDSLYLALISLSVSLLALLMIVLTVISGAYAVASKKHSYIINTVSSAVNVAFSVGFIVAVIAMNFEFSARIGSSAFEYYMPFSAGIVTATRAPYFTIVFSVLSRVLLIPGVVKRDIFTNTVSFDNLKKQKVCPICQTKHSADSKYCQNCGASLEKEERVCPNCHKNVADDAVFCNYCGVCLPENDGYTIVEEETDAHENGSPDTNAQENIPNESTADNAQANPNADTAQNTDESTDAASDEN